MTISNVQGSADTSTSVSPARLHHAAVQFESLLLKELIAPLTKGSDDENGDGAGTSPLQGFASDAVAASMAQSGALGFANEIERTLQHKVEKNSLPR